MRGRENEGPLPDPLAYFFTWSTYGTWLPGDQRGWVDYHRGWQLPSPVLELEARARMTEDSLVLNQHQRDEVEKQVEETCHHRNWELHTVNCRTNHMHAVISAPVHPKIMRAQLKAWCTRRLKSLAEGDAREHWWTERGSIRWIYDECSLEAAILYVRDGQEARRFL